MDWSLATNPPIHVSCEVVRTTMAMVTSCGDETLGEVFATNRGKSESEKTDLNQNQKAFQVWLFKPTTLLRRQLFLGLKNRGNPLLWHTQKAQKSLKLQGVL